MGNQHRENVSFQRTKHHNKTHDSIHSEGPSRPGSADITAVLKLLRTFLVCGINTFSHLFFAVGIHVHVREDPGLVGPQVVIGAKEVNGKLADIVPHPLDVLGDGFGMADFCWPPPSRAGEEEKPEERNQTSACAGGL